MPWSSAPHERAMNPTPLDGTWELVRAELDGAAAPQLIVAKTEMELVAGAYLVRFDGQVMDRGTFGVGAAGAENTLVLQGAAGPNAGRTIPCIFQLVGDRLRICYGLGGMVPAEFKTAAGQQRYLATYRRKK